LKVDNRKIYSNVAKNYLGFKDVMPVTSSKDENYFDLIAGIHKTKK